MNSIITYLVLYNQYLISTIRELILFIAKNIPFGDYKDNPLSPKYQKFTVDALPIIKKPEKLDYKVLIREYKTKHNKELKPIRSESIATVPSDAVCLRCGPPHNFLYDNNGGRGQLLCKVCKLTFNKDKVSDLSSTLSL